jgi:hypothetical protein
MKNKLFLSACFTLAAAYGTKAFAVECMTVSAPPSESLFTVKANMFSSPALFFSLISDSNVTAENRKAAEVAKQEFETYLLANPNPSEDLDKLYSKYLNQKVFYTRVSLDLLKKIRDKLDSQNPLLIDRRFNPKALEVDTSDPCHSFAKDLSDEEKKTFDSIRQTSRETLYSSFHSLKDDLKRLEADMLNQVELNDAEWDATAESALANEKKLIERYYAEVFKVRNRLGAEKTKNYLDSSNKRLSAFGLKTFL